MTMRLQYLLVVIIAMVGCDQLRNATTLSGYAVIGGKPSYVYTSTNNGREVTPLKNAEALTFEVIEQGPGSRFRYAKDSRQVYIEKSIIPGCSPATFRVLSRNGAFSRDANAVYFRGAPIELAEPDTFVVTESDFGKDATRAFIGTIMLPSVDIDSWMALGTGRAEDPCNRSTHSVQIKDPSELRGSGWSRDKSHVYYGERIVKGIDVESFLVLGGYYAKDRTSVFYGDSKVNGADAATFELLPGNHYSGPDSKDANASYRYGKVFTRP